MLQTSVEQWIKPFKKFIFKINLDKCENKSLNKTKEDSACLPLKTFVAFNFSLSVKYNNERCQKSTQGNNTAV